MRVQQWFVVTIAVGLISIGVRAAEKPPENYVKAMKDLGVFSAGIDKLVEAQDWDAIAMAAATAREAFVVTENYWNGKNTEAKELASIGAKQSQDLIAVAGQRSQEGAAFSAGEIKMVCGPCHASRREAAPDGTFLIK